MPRKFWQKIKIVSTIFVLSSKALLASSYFDSPIDYWQNSNSKAEKAKENFNWSKHLDPQEDEFFQEGNYLPPKPFMELARDPSDENIKNWFAMMERKNKLMARMQKNISAYLQKQGGGNTQYLQKVARKLPVTAIDFKRFRFRIYFESTCHHCKKMMATMKNLQDMGFYVEARQIDRKKPQYPVPFVVQFAAKEELANKKIQSWPVLLVADVRRKVIYRVSGYFSSERILEILRSQ